MVYWSGGRDREGAEGRRESETKIFSPLSLGHGKILGTIKAVYLQKKESAFTFVHNKRKLAVIHGRNKKRTE